MQHQTPNDALMDAISYTRMLLCRLSDAHYTHNRYASADVLIDCLDDAEIQAFTVLSIIDQVRDQMAVIAAIDRMASVSCGD